MGQGGFPSLDTSLAGEHNSLPEEVTLISLPLKIREGDGSPVRAVALIDWFAPPAAAKGIPG